MFFNPSVHVILCTTFSVDDASRASLWMMAGSDLLAGSNNFGYTEFFENETDALLELVVTMGGDCHGTSLRVPENTSRV